MNMPSFQPRHHLWTLLRGERQVAASAQAGCADEQRGRFALAQGTTHAAPARTWAQILAEHACGVGLPRQPELLGWLSGAHRRWQERFRQPRSPLWSQPDLPELGAASLAMVELTPSGGGFACRALVQGEILLVHLRDGAMRRLHPPLHEGRHRPCFFSEPIESIRAPFRLEEDGEVGDVLLLATGPLATWLRERPRAADRLITLADDEAFAALILAERAAGRLRDGDVALMVIRTAPLGWQPRPEPRPSSLLQEAAPPDLLTAEEISGSTEISARRSRPPAEIVHLPLDRSEISAALRGERPWPLAGSQEAHAALLQGHPALLQPEPASTEPIPMPEGPPARPRLVDEDAPTIEGVLPALVAEEEEEAPAALRVDEHPGAAEPWAEEADDTDEAEFLGALPAGAADGDLEEYGDLAEDEDALDEPTDEMEAAPVAPLILADDPMDIYQDAAAFEERRFRGSAEEMPPGLLEYLAEEIGDDGLLLEADEAPDELQEERLQSLAFVPPRGPPPVFAHPKDRARLAILAGLLSVIVVLLIAILLEMRSSGLPSLALAAVQERLQALEEGLSRHEQAADARQREADEAQEALAKRQDTLETRVTALERQAVSPAVSPLRVAPAASAPVTPAASAPSAPAAAAPAAPPAAKARPASRAASRASSNAKRSSTAPSADSGWVNCLPRLCSLGEGQVTLRGATQAWRSPYSGESVGATGKGTYALQEIAVIGGQQWVKIRVK